MCKTINTGLTFRDHRLATKKKVPKKNTQQIEQDSDAIQ